MKNLLLCFITLFIVISCKKEYVTITGEIDGQVLKKVYFKNIISKNIDSVDIVNGLFTYKTKKSTDEPKIHLIILEKDRKIIFIEDKDMSIYANRIDSFNYEVEVVGGKIQEEYDAIMKKADDISNELKKEAVEGYNKAKELNDSLNVEKYRKLYYKSQDLKHDYIIEYIYGNPKSYAAAFKMIEYSYDVEHEELKKYIDNFDSSLINTYPLQRLRQRYERLKLRPGVGSIAPDFTLNDVNNKPIKLSDEYKKVKYLLIEFWASWCIPCRKENPNLIKAYEKYNKKGFNILGVSWDHNNDDWKEAIEVDKLPWTQVISSKKNDVFRLYVLNSIPSNFLVDSNGKIVGIDLKGEELNKLLASLFEE